MNKLNIDGIKQDNVTIDINDAAFGISINIIGDIDMQDTQRYSGPPIRKNP